MYYQILSFLLHAQTHLQKQNKCQSLFLLMESLMIGSILFMPVGPVSSLSRGFSSGSNTYNNPSWLTTLFVAGKIYKDLINNVTYRKQIIN